MSERERDISFRSKQKRIGLFFLDPVDMGGQDMSRLTIGAPAIQNGRVSVFVGVARSLGMLWVMALDQWGHFVSPNTTKTEENL